MIYSILQILMIFIVPYLLIHYRHNKLTKLFGTIGMAYFLGLLVALIVFGLKKLGVSIEPNSDIGEIGSHLAIAIAIPLLLFSANLQETKKLSKTVLLSFGILTVSVVTAATIIFYTYGKANVGFAAELSGMAIGLYTGGTPNFNTIANIFGLDSTTKGIANLADIVTAGVFYMFLLSLCKPLLKKFLRTSEHEIYMKSSSTIQNTENLDLTEFKWSKRLIRNFFLAFAMAILGAGLGILVWILLGAKQGQMTDLLVPVMMLSVTFFGIAASFNKKVRETQGTNVVGHYLILVFSFALASALDLTKIDDSIGRVMLLLGMITILTFVLDVALSKVFNIDVDCMMVTLTAGLYSPAFVPAITAQIKNESLTVPGLICGSLGYAIGTFLGYLFGLLYML